MDVNWYEILLGSLLSTTAVVTIAAFVARESFVKLLDRHLATFQHELDIDAKRQELTIKSRIEYRERQLAEFYGPIYAILKRGRPVHKLWIGGRLDQIDKQLRELSVTSNNAIVEIILHKSHLIDGDEIPQSFIHYLSHVVIWHAHLEAGIGGVTVSESELPEAYYPISFENDVFETTERLKRELDALHRDAELKSVRRPA
jgi:hypothetical protein